MTWLRTIVTIVYVLVCIALTVVVIMQESKSSGLSGSISGAAESYWGKNKGRSMEGALVNATRVLGTVFIIISALLVMKW